MKDKTMFHVDVTIEDTRIVAREIDGALMEVTLVDLHSGRRHQLNMGLDVVGKMIALATSFDGEFVGEIRHSDIAVYLKDCPPECRPIP
jgi:hypothetical protein